MRKMIIYRCLLASILAVFVCGFISVIVIGQVREKELVNILKNTINIIESKYDLLENPKETAESLKVLTKGNRVTIISTRGEVLGDSWVDSSQLDNHIKRSEIASLQDDTFSVVKRYSDTTETTMIYVAKLIDESVIVRLGASADLFSQSFRSLLPAIILGVLGAIFFSNRIAKKTASDIIEPLNKVELAIINAGTAADVPKIELSSYQEINPIIKQLNSMSENLTNTVNMLEGEKQKYHFILENVNDGLVLIGMDLKILHINRGAKQYFNVGESAIGQDIIYLTRNEKLITMIKSSKDNQKSIFIDSETIVEGQVISVKITPAYYNEDGKKDIKGILVVLSDVTHVRRTEQLRSEFVANASHELKTPLTSVKGFSELLASGIITDQEVMNDYLGRIINETDRMISLSDDILNIYQLEEGKYSGKLELINLKTVAEEIINSLQIQIESKHIQLNMSNKDVCYPIEKEDIKHILQNLIDNAIKYNVENGSVWVEITDSKNGVKIVVQDTGIGIPRAYQTRVFERFYRVDKGRSRKVGGTGLGLAIVKHTVAKYKGEIGLYSREGKGCKFEIMLPNVE